MSNASLAAVPESDLDRLAREARDEIADAERALGSFVAHAWRAGQLLHQARDLCGRGEWLRWLESAGISQSIAWRCTWLAENYSDLNSLPGTMTAALGKGAPLARGTPGPRPSPDLRQLCARLERAITSRPEPTNAAHKFYSSEATRRSYEPVPTDPVNLRLVIEQYEACLKVLRERLAGAEAKE